MFPRYFSGEITNWPRLPCYSLENEHLYVGRLLDELPELPREPVQLRIGTRPRFETSEEPVDELCLAADQALFPLLPPRGRAPDGSHRVPVGHFVVRALDCTLHSLQHVDPALERRLQGLAR